MGDTNQLMKAAHLRASEQGFPFFGIVTPQEAYALSKENRHVRLIDVRTKAELDLVGRIPNAFHIEWAFYPGMIQNEDFSNQLIQHAPKDSLVIFICRTGGRSHNAAVTAQALGFNQAFNMVEGFEGEANHLQQRTLINGWKHANLPWTN
jgi:rhodanese-related sulfurtransferase